MDLRNRNTRKVLLQMLEKQLKSIMTENTTKVRYQEQLTRFQIYEDQKKARQKQHSPSPQLMRVHSQSDHIQFYERQQSQLKLKNERLQQSKEKSIQKKLYEEIQEATFHPKILKPKSQNTQKNDLYQQGMKWMQQKADHIDKLKESSMIQISQENLFKPMVNKVSEKIIKTTNQTDFFQRMNKNEDKKKEKIKRLKTDATPTFKPKINDRSKRVQSTLNKDILQVSVNLELLEKFRNYNQRDLNLSCHEYSRQRNCSSALSQSIDIDKQTSDYPSFRNSTTIKKQPKLQIDFNSPSQNMSEMLYEALGDQNYDYF
ncbi:unnamed protein product (macronuclear) [Paramecium tetraurelia]|uniref:Uncharacterized protein n=1 Tax=Paramecium tetraurelia TaxID=5888 RepID=A0DH41_PARTE|nr:uncharacterized protein GSPATT00016744001 [Paramecium tetraurelia]CAK82358.1 unnamed protein product [Paramecium tetraurelia]|eukprot:XP_001449755.1 hypothetical protein (macronuclear) [Paramecium tetraurelia strain d4-2]